MRVTNSAQADPQKVILKLLITVFHGKGEAADL